MISISSRVFRLMYSFLTPAPYISFHPSLPFPLHSLYSSSPARVLRPFIRIASHRSRCSHLPPVHRPPSISASNPPLDPSASRAWPSPPPPSPPPHPATPRRALLRAPPPPPPPAPLIPPYREPPRATGNLLHAEAPLASSQRLPTPARGEAGRALRGRPAAPRSRATGGLAHLLEALSTHAAHPASDGLAGGTAGRRLAPPAPPPPSPLTPPYREPPRTTGGNLLHAEAPLASSRRLPTPARGEAGRAA